MDAHLAGGGNQELVAMNRIINALWWGLFLFALAVCCLKDKAIELLVVMCFYALIAVCSAWCWCKEKIIGK